MNNPVFNLLPLLPFVIVPVAIIILLPPLWRRILFILGLLAAFGTGYVTDVRGADNPAIMYPLIGLGVAIGALLVEAIAIVVRLTKWLRTRQ